MSSLIIGTDQLFAGRDVNNVNMNIRRIRIQLFISEPQIRKEACLQP